jgi:hypothetical protein
MPTCPLCDADLDASGVCTSVDCPFVACPVCRAAGTAGEVVSGYPASFVDGSACGHLVMFEQGEASPRYSLDDAPGAPASVVAPPETTWFEEEYDLTEVAVANGLSVSEQPDFTPEDWTDQVLGWIGTAVAMQEQAQRTINQFGAILTWSSEPTAFWSRVDAVLEAVRQSPPLDDE